MGWELVGNLRGPIGPTGPDGEAGESGNDGHSPVLTWSGDQIAIDGTVSGPHLTGSSGPAGVDGSDGSDGAAGSDGHSPVLTWSGDQVAIDGVVSGPHLTGETGPAGADGSPDTAAQVLAKLITVDGASSGLDADLLDGQQATAFATSTHNHDAAYATLGHNHTGVYQPADSHLTTLSTDQYVEISTGSADGKFSGFIIAGTAGATLAFGDLIMKDAATSKWRLVDISTAAGSAGDARGLLGMCVLAASADAATKVLLHGMIRADARFPTLTVGSAAYATTAGAITLTQPSTADHIIRIVGFAHTADEIYFNPSSDYITHV